MKTAPAASAMTLLGLVVAVCCGGTPAENRLQAANNVERSTTVVLPQDRAFKLLTWNIQYGRDRGSDRNNWPKRKHALIAALRQADPDVMCVQEALADQLSFLQTNLAGHDVFGAGRDDGKSKGEHCAILYDSSRFHLITGGTFWLSDTPDQPSSTWGNEYPRICTWVVLRDKHSQLEFQIYNTHFPLKTQHRHKAIELVLRKMQAGRRGPTLLVGDFNEPLGPSEFEGVRRSGLSDCYSTAEKKSGWATYRYKGVGVARIDWVLTSHEWAVRQVRILDQPFQGVYSSDHNGVLVELEISN